MWANAKQPGFTIVELLIVVVVIAILAAITIVSYNGIQARAYDAAVKSDLQNIANQFENFKTLSSTNSYPAGDTQLATVGIRASKNAYGNGFQSNQYNLLYCRVAADGPNKFALLGASKSGNIFTYKSDTGSITTSSAWVSTSSVAICNDAGINQVAGTDRDIFYLSGAWMSYVGG